MWSLFAPSGGVSEQRIVHMNNPDSTPTYINNRVSNTKYSPWTFLFVSIFDQLRTHMNRYFLLVALLQLSPAITPVPAVTTWAPLAVVFAITALKEGADDLRRRRHDRAANERLYTVVTGGIQRELQSQRIRVGDVVMVQKDCEIPCDLLLLRAADSAGLGSAVCTLETANLDGETNWKARRALPETAALSPEQLARLRCRIECPPPNPELYKFDATLFWDESANDPTGQCSPQYSDRSRLLTIPLSAEGLLQQGTVLRNTATVMGVAIYTGNETKVGQNRTVPPVKVSKADVAINAFTVIIFVSQLVLAACLGIIGFVSDYMQSTEEGDDRWYLFKPPSRDAPSMQWIVFPLRFLLLNSMAIPISLKVTLDVVKMYYSWLLSADVNMYDETHDLTASAVNTSIAETLGQVEYVLTDKTGTLTQNLMVFKQCSVNGHLYGEHRDLERSRDMGRPEAGQSTPLGDLAQAVGDRNLSVHAFLRTLALCNTVDPVPVTPSGHYGAGMGNGDVAISVGRGTFPSVGAADAVEYQSSSPDEDALVKAAASLGFALKSRVSGHNDTQVVKIDVFNPLLQQGEHTEETFEIKHALGFTSDRKRMSVIVQVPNARNPLVAAVRQLAQQRVRRVGSGLSGRHGGTPGTLSGHHSHSASSEDSGDDGDLGTGIRGAGGSGSVLLLLCKGADEALFPRLAAGCDADWTVLSRHLELFASQGLRTLAVGAREIGAAEYKSWLVKWSSATTLVGSGREAATAHACNLIEKDLLVLGCTAIEDRLQEGVPAAVRDLRAAGMKLWMLTGDKPTTALQIAVACGMCAPLSDTQQYDFNGSALDGRRLATVLSPQRLLHPDLGSHSASRPRTSSIGRTEDPPPDDGHGTASRFSPVSRSHSEINTGEMALALSDDFIGILPLVPPVDGGGIGGAGGALPAGTLAHVHGPLPEDGNRTPEGVWTTHPLSLIRSRSPSRSARSGLGARHSSTGTQGDGTLHNRRRRTFLGTGASGGPNSSVAVADGRSVVLRLRGAHSDLIPSDIASATDVIVAHRAADPSTPVALVVEGAALTHALAGSEASFARLLMMCSTVVCCRASPAQKAALVSLVRASGHTALAIGDGGNDCAMIQAAHVGVGLNGREGLQAARAADFTLPRFAFLVPLCLVHGRYSLHRTAFIAKFAFYKSIFLCSLQVLFNTLTDVSGSSLLDPFSLMSYNMIFTAVPILFFVLDRDRERDSLLTNPKHYLEASSGRWLSKTACLSWCLRAILQAVVVFVGAMQLSRGDGVSIDQGSAAFFAFNMLLLVQTVTLSSEMHTPTMVNHVVNSGCILTYVLVSWILSVTQGVGKVSSAYGVFYATWAEPGSWLSLSVILAVTTFPWLMARYVRALAENECPFLPASMEDGKGPRYTTVAVDNSCSDSDGDTLV